MLCADCGGDGVWDFNDPGATSVVYCERCLPAFLRGRAGNGTLSRVEKPKAAKVTAGK